MKKFFEEYRNSLKLPEAEEVVDLILFRPVAFILVKTIYKLPITPNQISLLSVAFGLASASCFVYGDTVYYRIGGLLLLGANLLDCMDGQLARLQGSGTFLGRIIDGVADYITGIAVFIALGFGLKSTTALILVVGGGISSLMHGIAFDYYQGEFLKVRTGRSNITANDVEIYFGNKINGSSSTRMKEMFSRIYIFYLKIQNNTMRLFPENEGRMIRLWSFLGPSTNRSLLIIFCFIGIPLIYLFVVLIGGNIWFMICLLRQYSASKYSGNPKQ